MEDKNDNWDQHLDSAVFANASVKSTTKVTPFRMMFAREPRFPLEAERVYDPPDPDVFMKEFQESNVESVLEGITEKQEMLFNEVDDRIQNAQTKQKQ